MSPIDGAQPQYIEGKPADPVGHNIEAVVGLHLANERHVSRHQRFIELVTTNFGRPWLLFGWVVFAGGWLSLNTFGQHLGIRPWDPSPFPILEMLMTLAALLVAIAVLVTQNRQAKVDRRQAQLDLQLSLAIDQRAAKIIDLIEELRRDSPHLRDRVDPEAEILKAAVNPQQVVSVLEDRFDAALQEIEEEGEDRENSDRIAQPERKL